MRYSVKKFYRQYVFNRPEPSMIMLRIAFGQRTLAVEVLAVADAVRKDDAAAMYRELPE